MRLASFVFATLMLGEKMAKTFEALKRAEEEGRKKLNEGIVRRPLTLDHGLKLDVTEEYYRLKN